MPDELSFFLAENVESIEPIDVAVSKRIKDKDGNPVMWKLRPVPTDIANRIENECVDVQGRSRGFNTGKYMAKMCAAAVVYPDLMNAKLQDAWKVHTPEALLEKILSDKAEYNVVRDIALGTSDDANFENLVTESKN